MSCVWILPKIITLFEVARYPAFHTFSLQSPRGRDNLGRVSKKQHWLPFTGGTHWQFLASSTSIWKQLSRATDIYIYHDRGKSWMDANSRLIIHTPGGFTRIRQWIQMKYIVLHSWAALTATSRIIWGLRCLQQPHWGVQGFCFLRG